MTEADAAKRVSEYPEPDPERRRCCAVAVAVAVAAAASAVAVAGVVAAVVGGGVVHHSANYRRPDPASHSGVNSMGNGAP